ncbi:hypothetical protein BJ508DRAFT_80713 [Ascobolus immersus RN42]|uniref:Uncharacterized protein n=1 Tax=Ascobolus immersus RN42 TaxID=1160509 RepID=A0A3N4I9W5_ASCIM|nr:hypothetical protein BJ508DRAFT_80713 [Ascobolus immersus RN42]
MLSYLLYLLICHYACRAFGMFSSLLRFATVQFNPYLLGVHFLLFSFVIGCVGRSFVDEQATFPSKIFCILLILAFSSWHGCFM